MKHSLWTEKHTSNSFYTCARSQKHLVRSMLPSDYSRLCSLRRATGYSGNYARILAASLDMCWSICNQDQDLWLANLCLIAELLASKHGNVCRNRTLLIPYIPLLPTEATNGLILYVSWSEDCWHYLYNCKSWVIKREGLASFPFLHHSYE